MKAEWKWRALQKQLPTGDAASGGNRPPYEDLAFTVVADR
jgi:hypothetical protein